MPKDRKGLRCAIYTRKSSDEGLEQDFNSLDAQREAGEAYVKSQAHEGWQVVPTLYDDGGFSGGSMERPALQKLLGDVDAGLIDVVVVYKIDRLTRSLPDFARIVERFDAKEISFVSVTQSFNTTSSMGRLTLNVLLSFAQFEREVTGERIRDKIAASKAKGMWMGGVLPLGYDLPAAGSRILQVNEAEAKTVRHVFARYIELGSVHKLQRDLARRGVTSKRWTTSKGNIVGGVPFNRGALFHLLKNPIYLGKIRHKGIIHEGGHDAIIDEQTFDRVQLSLVEHAPRRRRKSPNAKSYLTGRLFDATGEAMTPVHTRNRHGTLYRYYVSASLQQGAKPSNDILQRISASDLEKTLGELLARWLPNEAKPLDYIFAIRLKSDGLLIDLEEAAAKDITLNLGSGETILHSGQGTLRIAVPLALPLRGGKRLVIAGSQRPARPDQALNAALRNAHRMLAWSKGMPSLDASPASIYNRQILRLALLAPDLQADILAGRQPPTLTLEALKAIAIPIGWNAQRETLGWNA
ncbi:recombinase family protein [Qipengyuania oceanensis]|uniref:Recombinase family protein n=1 Tax=Qipengyuania oceanensis TaxID=1463597 RepID=A0A844YKA3_9SPHN|nr:recombinase family protein [Qipengyuania oceanensis]MXO63935.1 recombinase family protein [Qipengyuania oceanensis]